MRTYAHTYTHITKFTQTHRYFLALLAAFDAYDKKKSNFKDRIIKVVPK